MSVRRVMGIETEYGISHPGHPGANPMRMSALLVSAYGQALPGSPAHRWDFDAETPLRDARGFELTRTAADRSALTDDDVLAANLVLTNGARFYVDHAHPEYSGPETTSPRAAVCYDRAGTVVLNQAAELAARMPGGHEIRLYKNNSDGKGSSYGSHENYLMDRRIPFRTIAAHLIPFFVTRQIFAGAGRVGLGIDSRAAGYQISSRADFFEAEVGLETTLKRPIVNTRDEPHADPAKYRRLHVIVGDANLADNANLLKLGSTALVLSLIESHALPDPLVLDHPVAALRSVSHDLTLREPIAVSGQRWTALEIQEYYLLAAQKHMAERECDPDTAEVLTLWAEVLDGLSADPLALADRLDWVAKLQLLEGYRARDGLGWEAPRLAQVDLQYADIHPQRGLARKLEANGRLRRLVDPALVAAAVTDPPADTRAWFRGECVRRFAPAVAAASWDSVVFDVPGRSALVRIATPEPLRGTRELVGPIMDRAGSAADLVKQMGA
ncbi:MAG: depupylase/deamidase Dop [Candidatus Nanopelagicales bacterium]